MFKAFLTNSMGILCSRVFGFVRDLCMALFLGAGIASDIFFVAFKLPNLFRRIFAEGAFVQSFLPSFIDTRKKAAFSVIIFNVFFCFIFVLSLCVWEFSGVFTKALASGFDDVQIELAKPIVAINFWYLELIFCASFLSALLQYKNCFWVSAYNTALLNICMIIALFIARDENEIKAVYVLSYGVLCGGFAQILLHFYPLFRLKLLRLFSIGIYEIIQAIKYSKKLPKKLDSIVGDVKGFFRQFFPALLGSSTAQIASFLDTLIASFLATGAISYLYYANRIFQLPLAVFAIAASSALFPTIAKAVKNKEEQKALVLLKRAFWLLAIILCMCMVGGIILREEIIWLLFERGKFVREDTLAVAGAFAGYMVGLLPFGLARIFSLWLYAHKQQGKAAKISAISLFCGVGFSLVLMQPFGVVGLALASSLGGVLYFWLTIRIFGTNKFLHILNNPKACIVLVIIILVEIAILKVFQAYENVFGILI